MKPLVSILIPAYNSEKLISDTINSCLSQTWPSKEIIIVNDGSTDRTLQIAKNFESKTVKIVSQENMGAQVARNKALEYSQGDYIQWLDADDILHPDKISEQLKVLESENNSRVFLTSSFGTFYFRTQNAIFRPSSLWQDLTPVEWMIKKFSDNVWMNPATWLVSRKLSELTGPWDEKLSWNQDGEYICRIVSGSEKVKFVPEAKCYYRIGNIGGISSSINHSEKRLQSQFLSIAAQIRHLLNLEDSERTKSACIKHLQENYIYFYPDNIELMKRVNDLAKDIGGLLTPPVLKYKYRIIQNVFGLKIAKKALLVFPKVKRLGKKYYDKYLGFI